MKTNTPRVLGDGTVCFQYIHFTPHRLLALRAHALAYTLTHTHAHAPAHMLHACMHQCSIILDADICLRRQSMDAGQVEWMDICQWWHGEWTH
jgi:hypothetical protein